VLEPPCLKEKVSVLLSGESGVEGPGTEIRQESIKKALKEIISEIDRAVVESEVDFGQKPALVVDFGQKPNPVPALAPLPSITGESLTNSGIFYTSDHISSVTKQYCRPLDLNSAVPLILPSELHENLGLPSYEESQGTEVSSKF
jgi:hypothetical protein